MPEENNGSRSGGIFTALPNYLIFAAMFSGGLGTGTAVAPRADVAALQQCSQNAQAAMEISKTALQNAQVGITVAEQHGGEMQHIRDDLHSVEMRQIAFQTIADTERRWREQGRRDQLQDKAIESLEKK